MLMFPSWNPALWPCRALGFERTTLTGRGPVAPYPFAIFFAGEAMWQLLPSRTAIGIFLWHIDKVLLAEAPIRLGARCLRLGESYRDAGLVAREDLRAAEVAAIGNGLEHVGLQDSLRLLGHIGQLRPI